MHEAIAVPLDMTVIALGHVMAFCCCSFPTRPAGSTIIFGDTNVLGESTRNLLI